MTVLRFAALGDSLTAGIGDPMPDGGWRGWARLLADALAGTGGLEFHNFAASGARVADLAGGQLVAALAVEPQFASLVVGVNDTLRSTFDPRAFAAALRYSVVQLQRGGAVVLTATLPDPGRMFGLPAALARPLARRMRAINVIVDEIADRCGTCHVDLAGHPTTYEQRMWSVDRLHPNERGHRLLAGRFADHLAEQGFPVLDRPATEPAHPPPSVTSRAWWLAYHGTGWLLRRSTDLVPSLAALVVAEWWYGWRGAAARLDHRSAGKVGDALALLPAGGSRLSRYPTPRRAAQTTEDDDDAVREHRNRAPSRGRGHRRLLDAVQARLYPIGDG